MLWFDKICLMLPFKQTSVLYFDFRGTFSELNRFASPNQYWTPSFYMSIITRCFVSFLSMVFPVMALYLQKVSYFGMEAMPFLCDGPLVNQFNISRVNLLWTLNWQKCTIIMLVFHSLFLFFYWGWPSLVFDYFWNGFIFCATMSDNKTCFLLTRVLVDSWMTCPGRSPLLNCFWKNSSPTEPLRPNKFFSVKKLD